ncbi:MAG: flagellar biosynthesis anti-sigma factor FlgM [Armatimonadota bacterium]|nr:flagellar biosynthesis anti-sigma factor FlgM [Armatimonadota bacterium]
MKISSFESGKAGHVSPASQPAPRILPKDRPRRRELRSHLAEAQLTPLEQGILKAERALEKIPDIRHELVEPLKKAIQEGTYKVSGQDIADMMIRRRLADKIR